MGQGPVYLVLLGAPGAGKGTQAGLLTEKVGLTHVSSGDLFRENLGKKTALGLEAKTYMDKGELVPDDLTIRMVMERLGRPDCVKGVILDGFPRTLAQAQALDSALAEQQVKLAMVPYIRVAEGALLRRLAGRWTCKECKAVYHEIFSPTKVAGVCDECGGELYQRPDDTPETQKNRIDVYMSQTQPLIAYYQEAGVLVEVDGEGDVPDVHEALMQALEPILD